MGKLSRIGLLATLVVVAFSTSAFAAVTTGGSHSARPLITGKINNNQLVTLPGNTHPATRNPELDRGAVADDLPMKGILLQLKRSPEQERALAILMDQLHTPGNANYHKWLTEQQYDEAFGVNQQDVDKVVAWLESQGLEVNGVMPDGMVIEFSGTASTVSAAFHTEIHNIQLKNGEKHIANIRDPQIPAALADVVVGPAPLHNFFPHPTNIKRNKVAIGPKGELRKGVLGPKGNYTFPTDEGTYYAFVPGDAQTIYNITPLLSGGTTGKGQTIGLVEDSDAYKTTNGLSADWTSFVKTFGLTSYGGTQTTVNPAGSLTCTDPGDTNDGTDFEVALDIDYASATAPGANVVVESCADTFTTFGGLLAVENLASATTIAAPVISISYGYCETGDGAASNAAFSYAYQHGAARGMSIFVSSGDESSRSCDADEYYAVYGLGVSGWTSTPYNVSVGGTDFGDTYAGTNATYWNSNNASNYSSAKSYVPEIPWNDSCASELISGYVGYGTTYGTSGFCASSEGTENFITTASGSGGASNCYSGTSANGVANGTCKGQPKPSWQSVLGNPADGVRDIPDVSLFASNGVWSHYLVLCYSNTEEPGGAPCTGAPSGWAGAGGTSASSPMMAGIQTLINQYNGELSGNPNYVYYKIASKEYGSSGDSTCNSTKGATGTTSCIFYDVTQGDMNVPCSYFTGTTGYNCYDVVATGDDQFPYIGVGALTNSAYSKTYGTTTGWDFATGIGSVNAYNLAKAWKTTAAGGYPLTATVSVTGSATTYQSGAGGSIAYTATVTGTGSYPTGSVILSNGSTSIGTGTLTASAGCANGGTCTETTVINYSPGSLAAGTYTITATYSSTNENYGTASGTTTLKVTGNTSATTTTAVTVSPSPVGYGQTAALKATITASSGTASGGSVTFTASGVTLGSCTVAAGTCTFSASTLGQPLGTYHVVGTYAGTTGFDGSTSPAVLATLQKANTTTTLVITPAGTITPPATATLTATVTRPSGYAGTPSGTVNFYYGSDFLGSASLSSGKAILSHSSSGLPAGSYKITADYAGDGDDNTSSGTATATLN